MSSFPCPTCGGALPDERFRRLVRCPYCSKDQPNRNCVQPDDEVLVQGGIGKELARVLSCDGPDAIVVQGRTYRFEDLIPVLRPPANLEAGVAVFRRNAAGWAYTFTASAAHDGQIKLKHADAAFQDAFFDEQASLDDVRLDARPPELGGMHGKRSALGTWFAGTSMFDLFVKGFIAVIFIVVGVSVLRTFLFR